MAYVLAGILLVSGAAALVCSRIARPDRNYWPLVRVIFAALAFVYCGSGVARLLQAWQGLTLTAPATTTGLVFAATILGVLLYGVWFMRKRNRLARFLGLTIGGDIVLRSVEELDAAAVLTESWAFHGSLPPARAAGLRLALDEWERKRRWEAGLRGERGAT